MKKILYKEKIEGRELIITDKHISYGGVIIPAAAISLISIKSYFITWWIPIFLLLASILLFVNDHELLHFALLFFFSGLAILIYAIIFNKKKSLRIYSHSGKCLSFTWMCSNTAPLLTAIYNLIETPTVVSSEELIQNNN